MSLLVLFVVGAAVAALLWVGLRRPFAVGALQRPNYRGEVIPTAAGFVALLAYVTVVAAAGWLVAQGWLDDTVADRSRSATLPLVLGFGLLGLFDDLAGSGHHRGFAGHAAALREGRVTTGLLKLVGGALVALAALVAVETQPARLVLDAALVALGANLANLLDRAPGRTTKVAVLVLVVLALGTQRWSELAGPGLMVGAAAGLLVPELRERAMLGDTGANALGAALALGAVLTLDRAWRVGILAVLVLLNLASERVSFSTVIDATPPLRWFDRLGARRRP